MKKYLFILLLFALTIGASADDKKSQVGIDENETVVQDDLERTFPQA